jgi:hypothetical protein
MGDRTEVVVGRTHQRLRPAAGGRLADRVRGGERRAGAAARAGSADAVARAALIVERAGGTEGFGALHRDAFRQWAGAPPLQARRLLGGGGTGELVGGLRLRPGRGGRGDAFLRQRRDARGIASCAERAGDEAREALLLLLAVGFRDLLAGCGEREIDARARTAGPRGAAVAPRPGRASASRAARSAAIHRAARTGVPCGADPRGATRARTRRAGRTVARCSRDPRPITGRTGGGFTRSTGSRFSGPASRRFARRTSRRFARRTSCLARGTGGRLAGHALASGTARAARRASTRCSARRATRTRRSALAGGALDDCCIVVAATRHRERRERNPRDQRPTHQRHSFHV